MKKILFVDDELHVLNFLKLLFSHMDYEVFTAEDGERALGLLDSQKIDLVVSDTQMPGMNGFELLQRVKERHPGTIRVILGGFADEKKVIKALQNNVAKIYLFKPWENKTLVELIEHLFETEDILLQSNLYSAIDNTGELPTIRQSYKNILSLTESDAELEEIAEGIERDQSIAGKFLHIANSAFYGLKTGSVTQAVKYLGLNTIRNLVLSTPVMDSLQSKGAGARFAEKQWEHAYLTNKLLFFIYGKYFHKSLPEVEGTAGLLHNIGVAFLLKYHPAEYGKCTQKAGGEGGDILLCEREAFKIAHTEAGGYLLNWWELPYPVVEAALYHHQPFENRIINKELVMSVHLSQKYAGDMLQYPHSGVFCPEVFETLKISREKFEKDIAAIRL